MKKNNMVLMFVVVLFSIFVGYMIGKSCNTNNTEDGKLYLPVYEFKTDIKGDTLYANDFESLHGAEIYKLNRVIPCQFDFCKWVKSDSTTQYGSNWIMFDGDDPNDVNARGGYYFFDFEDDKTFAGPFDDIELEVPMGGQLLRKVIVFKDNKYGLYDIIEKNYIFPVGSETVLFINDSNHVLYEKDGKYQYYLFEGTLKELIKEYDNLDDFSLDNEYPI